MSSVSSVATLVYSGGQEGVEAVAVNRRFILRDGHFVNVDEGRALRELQRCAVRLVERTGVG